MKITKDISDTMRQINIFPFDDNSRSCITVVYRKPLGHKKWNKPTISWSGMGQADLETTILVSQALIEAIDIARDDLI